MTSDPSSKKPSSPHESKGESTIELLFGELENELEQQTAQSVPVHPESSVQTPSLQQHKSEHKAFAAPVETSIKHFERPRASQKAAPPPIPDAAVQSALHTPSNLIRGSTAGTESTISKSELEPSVRTDRDIRQDPLEEAARLLIDSCEQELTEGPKPSRAAKLHYELGRLHEFPIRDLRRAAAHYREALEHAPEHVPCLHGLRRVLVGGKNYPSTLPLFDSEIRITRDNKKKAALYFEKGRLLEDVMQRREEAKEAYVSALELHKGDESILKALRQCQLDTHSFEELDKAYEQSANIVTSDSRHRAALIIERARLIEVQNPNSDEALELYETALKLDPEASQALAALKRLHSLHNRHRDLIRILEREAERTTDCRVRTMSLLRVGKIHAERLGNRAEAISAMERALRESPGDPTIISELAALYEEGNFQEPLIDALTQLTSLVESDEERLALLHRIGQLCEESPDRRE
ncbi:MAG: tetratricopeptide repeat protein, partial [Myxococcota bacterium]